MANRFLRLILVTLALFAGASAGPGLGQELVSVPIRAWDHGTYGRIVFNWPAPVGYQARIRGQSLEVEFNRPLIPSFTSVFQRLGDYVTTTGMSGGNRIVRFGLTGQFDLRDFATDGRVVVDLVRPEGGDAAASPAPSPVPNTANDNPGNVARLSVRFGVHPDYNRVVFDWPQNVGYRIQTEGPFTTVVFDRPALVDDAALSRSLPPLVTGLSSSVSNGGLQVRLGHASGASIRDFRLDNRIVVDVLASGAASAPQSQAPDQNEPALAVPTPPAAPPPAPLPPEPAGLPETEEIAEPAAADDARSDNEEQSGAEPVDLAGPIAPSSESRQADPQSDPGAGGEQAIDGDAEEAAEPELDQVAGADDDIAPGDEDQSNQLQTERGQMSDGVMIIGAAKRNDGGRLRFDWDVPVAAAVFLRAEALWVVFDAPALLDFDRVDETGLATRAQQVDMPGATVARFTFADEFVPTVSRSGTAWVVDLSARRGDVKQIPIVLEDQSEVGSRILLTSAEPGSELILVEPELGDSLVVVPLATAGQGVSPGRRFVDLELLPTAQGIVVLPKSDEVAVRSLREGVEITTLSGLNISPREDRVGLRPTAAQDPADQPELDAAQFVPKLPDPEPTGEDVPLFEFADWRRLEGRSFKDSQQFLNIRLSRSPAETRNDARMNLARFYFANSMAAETLGWIDQTLSDSPWMERDQGLVAMRAASNVMMDRFNEASIDLFDERFDVSSEMALWRGIYLAETGNQEAANEQFIKASRIIERYPRKMRAGVRLTIAENALSVGQIDQALSLLDTVLVDRPSPGATEWIEYLRGLATAQLGRPLEAVEILEVAAAANDRETRAKAGRDLAELMLAQGLIGPAEAAERFEDLRFAWRGDEFELELLKRLGDLYIEAGDFEKGLVTFREAISIFPDSQAVREIAQTMNDTFKDLFLGGQADALAPVTALGIYYNFRELTPVGNLGDQMIFRLADRLVAVDLLEQAADLLQHQVEYRLRGNELARVGARLAEIYLLDDRPLDAIKSLRASDIVRMSEELSDQRRYLMARAQLKNRQYEKALALLGGDQSWEAEVLRADIYWSQQDFLAEATVLSRMLRQRDSETPLTASEENMVMKLAVSLALANNRSALSELRERFGQLMAATASRDAFDGLASYVDTGPIDPSALTNTVQEINSFESYMASLRERVSDDNLSAIN